MARTLLTMETGARGFGSATVLTMERFACAKRDEDFIRHQFDRPLLEHSPGVFQAEDDEIASIRREFD